MIHVRIPTPLRPLAGGKDEVEVDGQTVGEVIAALESRHSGLKGRVCDERGELRRFINVYVNQDDVRSLAGVRTAVKAGDTLSILPAIAGGTGRRG